MLNASADMAPKAVKFFFWGLHPILVSWKAWLALFNPCINLYGCFDAKKRSSIHSWIHSWVISYQTMFDHRRLCQIFGPDLHDPTPRPMQQRWQVRSSRVQARSMWELHHSPLVTWPVAIIVTMVADHINVMLWYGHYMLVWLYMLLVQYRLASSYKFTSELLTTSIFTLY